MAVDVSRCDIDFQDDIRRFRKITIFAIFWTLILSVFAVAGSVFLYLCLKFNLGVCGDVDLFEGTDRLYVPVGTEVHFQEVLLLCTACGYLGWLPCVITLAVGLAKHRAGLYVPWLIWSGLMSPLCVFGCLHMMCTEYDVCIYVLAEYLLAGVTVITTVPLSIVVYSRYLIIRRFTKEQ